MKKIIMGCLLLLGACTSVKAQEEVQIVGVVQDGEGQPLPYATVAAYKDINSKYIKATTANEKGAFTLPLGQGTYILKLTFLALEAKLINIVVGNKAIDLGNILITDVSIPLEEVEIVGEKKQMELKLDRRVFNIEKDLSNRGSDATEMLQNIPSVSVDVEGNVSLRGSENVRILINGKPASMMGFSSSEALKQLQSDQVEKVEVITNPSARYDAEGESGIINIILKQEQRAGINGAINVKVGEPSNYGASVNVNYKQKKLNYFTSIGTHYRKRPGSGNSYQQFFYEDTSYAFDRYREHERGGFGINFSGGVNVNINKKNTVTLNIGTRFQDGQNESIHLYKDYNSNRELVQTVNRDEQEQEDKENYSWSLSYDKKFSQNERVWTNVISWSKRVDIEQSEIGEYPYQVIKKLDQRINNEENVKDWMFQSDYVHPIRDTKGQLEMGVKASGREIDNIYLVEEKDSGEAWTVVRNFDDVVNYQETILAGYGMLGSKLGRLSYQIGLRVEQALITTKQEKLSVQSNQDYANLFPTAHISYELPSNTSIQLSYARRIYRPQFRHLLSFYGYSDSRNFYSGNVNLMPQFTDAYELGYLNQFEKGSFLSSLFFRSTAGIIQRVSTVDSEGFIRTIPINLGSEKAWGMEFVYNHEISTWLSVNANVSPHGVNTKGEYDSEVYDREAFLVNARLGSSWTYRQKTTTQLNWRYQSPQQTTQGRRLAMNSIDISVAHSVLKNKATLTVSVKDLLNTWKSRYIRQGVFFSTEGSFQWVSRQFLASFSYQFGKKVTKRRGGSSDDEQNKIDDNE